MKLSVLRELEDIETRVSATPESIKLIKRLGFEIFVEEGAGIKSGYYDKDYIEAGAQIVSRSECLKLKDVCLVVKMPSEKDSIDQTKLEFSSHTDPYICSIPTPLMYRTH